MSEIRSKPATEAYRETWERVWGKKEPENKDFVIGIDTAKEVTKLKGEGSCSFDTPEGCEAAACYSSQKCGSRDEKGNPRYK